MPRSPETHARLDAVMKAEAAYDVDAMVEELMDRLEWRDFSGCPSYRPPKQLRTFHSELGGRATA